MLLRGNGPRFVVALPLKHNAKTPAAVRISAELDELRQQLPPLASLSLRATSSYADIGFLLVLCTFRWGLRTPYAWRG